MELEKTTGKAKMLRIFIGERELWEGKPLYEAIVLKLREMDIAGATVYQGAMGYGARQRVHRSLLSSLSAFFRLSTDKPSMITVIDEEEKIDRIIPILSSMVAGGLITVSKVDVIKYSHGQPDIEDLSLSPDRPNPRT